MELKSFARCHCICLVLSHRLTGTTIYLGNSLGQIIWPDVRLNFQIDHSSQNAYDWMRFDARHTLVLIIYSIFSQFKSNWQETLMCLKYNLFCLNCPVV